MDLLHPAALIQRNQLYQVRIIKSGHMRIIECIREHLEQPREKFPTIIQKYGNTSSTSVPLTIVSELHDKLKDGQRVIMSGFGAGLSWGTANIVFNQCKISPVIEYLR